MNTTAQTRARAPRKPQPWWAALEGQRAPRTSRPLQTWEPPVAYGVPLPRVAPAEVLVGVEMGALLRFRSLMALEHQRVQVARMCYDRIYAYERIATAFGCASDPLKRLALELFLAYHRQEHLRAAA